MLKALKSDRDRNHWEAHKLLFCTSPATWPQNFTAGGSINQWDTHGFMQLDSAIEYEQKIRRSGFKQNPIIVTKVSGFIYSMNPCVSHWFIEPPAVKFWGQVAHILMPSEYNPALQS
jgi:hypothetical protein